jgi:putative phosphoribosyl transferase
MRFDDRQDAGRQLAARLTALAPVKPVVLALPRGGVPVGFEIARALSAPLDVLVVRKIGAPHEAELAIGAIADGPIPELVIDAHLVRTLKVSKAYLREAEALARQELERRRQAYRPARQAAEIAGCTAIIVDDGIATGATTLAAVRATRARAPASIVLAVPVAAADALRRLEQEVDRVVCLDAPEGFIAVGHYYRRFPQLRDEEVISLLSQPLAGSAPFEAP